jgi:methyl-accepting chemotaxis protein
MKLNLSKKIMLMTGAVLLVSVIGIGTVSVLKSKAALNDQAKDELVKLAAMSKSLCRATAIQAQLKAESDIKVASAMFDEISNKRVEIRDGKMVLDPGGQNMVINSNYQFVDQVSKETGSHCTIFLSENGQAKRIATTVLDDKGNRAINTTASQAVYDAVIGRGSSYKGRAWVVNAWYTTAYEPIRDTRNQVVGILFVGVKEGAGVLREALLSHKIGKTGYIYAIDTKGVLQIHPAKEGSDISKYDFIQEMTKKGPSLAEGEIGWITYPWMNKELGDTKPRDKGVAYAYFKDWDWVIGVGSYLDEFNAPAIGVRNAVIYLGIGFMLLSLLIAFYISRTITRPVVQLVKIAEAVTLGDASQEVEVRSSDEVGVLADGFRHMVDYLRSVSGAAQRIADNDLTVHLEPRSEKDTLGISFKGMVANLSGVVRELSQNSSQVVAAATEVASTSEEMAKGAQKQSSQASQVSAAVEEMTATIVESSRNAAEAATQAKEAAEAATQGRHIVSQTIEGMNQIAQVVHESAKTIEQLSKSSDQIGEIIGVIDDIADQTNLLALNAAIEAARAGEQGRGFAVVADEVRKLAERTTKATKEITDMIRSIQNETKGAVTSMEQGIKQVESGRVLASQAGESLGAILGYAQRVREMIQQVASAGEQQSQAAEEIARSVEGIAEVTKQSTLGAEQSASAAEELNRQADGLQQMVARFKTSE